MVVEPGNLGTRKGPVQGPASSLARSGKGWLGLGIRQHAMWDPADICLQACGSVFQPQPQFVSIQYRSCWCVARLFLYLCWSMPPQDWCLTGGVTCLCAQVFLEDAGFDWKILGPDVRNLDYVAYQCDQDAYACSGQKCSATSLLMAHTNYMQAGACLMLLLCVVCCRCSCPRSSAWY